jgi:alpha-beta hydrolase superfamily lysophospholipase
MHEEREAFLAGTGPLKCPYLCVAGEDDQLSPIEFSHEFFNRLKTPKKLVVYEGAEHGIIGAASAALGESPATLIIDWLEDRLAAKPMGEEKVFIDATGRATVTPA